ncbi:MAG: lipopolysaccharide transport periplasmic protein LptA [Rhodobiaceae bacterium]|nr:lipopolysaccharide transport periplasmic protein LptA [Rhodobiaceae bacterium]MCC0055289.1 lipopolysaccharide transport periplasmic protein LptA [Rhodobiaceae bacterium]
MNGKRFSQSLILALALLAPVAGGAALAQAPKQNEGSASSFQIDSDKPVKIEADKLDIQDKEQTGTFSGNVFVQQGDMTLRTSKLVVHYSGNAGDRGKKEESAGQVGSNQKITRLEARGKVLIRSKDQEATGEWADYSVSTRTIKLGGGVVLTQGPNVLRGEELLIDLNTGKSRLTNTAKDGGRVRGLFLPSTVDRTPKSAQ